MNFEKAVTLGNRHLQGNAKFEVNALGKEERVVRIVASAAMAETHAGQQCLWMLTNLLARQFAIITALEICVPEVSTIPGVAIFGVRRTLKEVLISTATFVAGDALDVREGNAHLPPDVEAGVGCFQPTAPFSIGVLGDGWRVAAGKPQTIPLITPTSDYAFGPYFAACLAAGDVFKHLARLKPGCGNFTEQLTFSLWDYQKSNSWDSASAGVLPAQAQLSPFYLVGAGAVGQAAVASLAASPSISGYATIIDDETIDATNRNRYVLAHSGNINEVKVLVASKALERANFRVVPYPYRWESYVQGLNRPEQQADIQALEKAWKFRRVLSCVDKNTPRHSIQNVWPELILGGSTLECGILVQAYDLRTDGECLKCANPIEADGRTIESEVARWRRMSPEQRRQAAEANRLDIAEIERYLEDPKCGELGEQEIAKFSLDQEHDWSVGFVSVAAGVLLASKLVQSELLGIEAAFPPAQGQALRFSFLNPGPFASRHQRNPACNCASKGLNAYGRLWVHAAIG